MAESQLTFDLVVAANRLPVDRIIAEDGTESWQRSPGGLVSAMQSVMADRQGAWVGWPGEPDLHLEPFTDNGTHLEPVTLSAQEVADYYEGFSNDTLWPIYHDVIVPASFHRHWWEAYLAVNHRFAQHIARVTAPGGTVWVHDYQLQLVPALLRELRPDVRIGWFNHIPFPPTELFAQLPWRTRILEGLMGADFLGFQRSADADNFLRACRRFTPHETHSGAVHISEPEGATRYVRVATLPISIDFAAFEERAQLPEVQERSAEIRDSLGNPQVLMLGVDRLDYTKGIRHRLKAYRELIQANDEITPYHVTLVQVAVPSRERVAAYRNLKNEIEGTVGRINGDNSEIGATSVHYLHQSFDPNEMAALYQAADVMLVTPLRDGMNLVAKEYVACRHDGGGALVLSEFAGAACELTEAYTCNPHDIQGLKEAIVKAIRDPQPEKQRRMAALRDTVRHHDVHRWAQAFLDGLTYAPAPRPHTHDEFQEDILNGPLLVP